MLLLSTLLFGLSEVHGPGLDDDMTFLTKFQVYFLGSKNLNLAGNSVCSYYSNSIILHKYYIQYMANIRGEIGTPAQSMVKRGPLPDERSTASDNAVSHFSCCTTSIQTTRGSRAKRFLYVSLG